MRVEAGWGRSIRAAVFAGALVTGASSAGAESPAIDATDSRPPPTRSSCLDNDECLSHEYCSPERVCVACSTPTSRCTSDTECGAVCAGMRCVEGRCVRASATVDRDVVVLDASGDAMDGGVRGLRTEGPSAPGCGARVGPSTDKNGPMAFAALAAGAAMMLVARRRRAWA